MPVIVKSYKETKEKLVLIYAGQYFDIFSFLEFIQLYAKATYSNINWNNIVADIYINNFRILDIEVIEKR